MSSENLRTETFSDGVFAIAITLLVLEIKVPPVHEIHSNAELWTALAHLWPSYFSFLFSFAVILVTWLGHHTMFSMINKTSMRFMYANAFLLFTITLIPFTTGLLAEYLDTDFARPAAVTYCAGTVLHYIAWRVVMFATIKPKILLREPAKVDAVYLLIGVNLYTGGVNFLLMILAWWFPLTAVCINASMWLVWIVYQIRVNKM